MKNKPLTTPSMKLYFLLVYYLWLGNG